MRAFFAISCGSLRWCDTPMANLLLTILDGGGVHLEKFGDSNGRILEPLSIS